MKVLFSVGEVSGDIAGAAVARELRRRAPGVELNGIGGKRMEEAGVTLDERTDHLGTVGIAEVLRTGPGHLGAFVRLVRRLKSDRPDVAVLIANDIFNVVLGRLLRARGIRTVSYFPPQVWIWRALARTFVKSFDLILACFPEEQTVYEGVGGSVTFVGHYLADGLSPAGPAERRKAREALKLPDDRRVVGLLPGSRIHEIRRHLPVLLEAAERLLVSERDLHFVLPAADPIPIAEFEQAAASPALRGRVSLVRASHEAMRASDVVLITSGTATLEAALLGVPMVILYHLSWFTILVARVCRALHLLRWPPIGLPNIILGRDLVPELIQADLTPANVAAAALGFLRDPARLEATRRELAEIGERLAGMGSVERAAKAILAAVDAPEPARGTSAELIDAPAPAREGR